MLSGSEGRHSEDAREDIPARCPGGVAGAVEFRLLVLADYIVGIVIGFNSAGNFQRAFAHQVFGTWTSVPRTERRELSLLLKKPDQANQQETIPVSWIT